MRYLRIFCVASLYLCLQASVTGQSNVKVGFELGWTNSRLSGDYEVLDGREVEAYRWNSGFTMSLFVRRYFTDEFALQTGFGFAQRNNRYEYDGDSYHLFDRRTETPTLRNAYRVESIKHQMGYLDVPLMAVYHVGRHFEVGAGGYVGLLINARGDGDIRIRPREGADDFEPFIIQEDANYISDGFLGLILGDRDVTPFETSFGNREPRVVNGTYSYFEDPDTDRFYRWEAGMLAHVAYYFNNSLNVKAKFLYGLTDRTRAGADVAKSSYISVEELGFRDDMDRALSMQVTIGFSF